MNLLDLLKKALAALPVVGQLIPAKYKPRPGPTYIPINREPIDKDEVPK